MVVVDALYHFRLEEEADSNFKLIPLTKVGFHDTFSQLFREPSQAKIIKNIPEMDGMTVIGLKPANSLQWPLVLNLFPSNFGFGRCIAPAKDAIIVKRIHDEFQAIVVKGMKYLSLPLLQIVRQGGLDQQILKLNSALN